MNRPNGEMDRLGRKDLALSLLLGGVSLALYVRTLAPWVLPGDSGEFQVLSYQVGTGHTPGYPVYILLSKIFLSLLPIRDVAYRVSLFSAVLAAVAVAGVYLSIRMLTNSRWGAVFGASALAVSFTFWSQAVIAEVYTPSAAILVAVWLLVLIWRRRGSRWALFGAGVCGGLALGIHASAALAAPAVVIFLLAYGRRWREWIGPAVLGGLTGLALFLAALAAVDANAPAANSFQVIYGPARSAWNMTETDTRNPLARMEFLLLAKQWTGQMFADPAEEMPAHWQDYRGALPREFSIGTLLLAGLGLLTLAVRDWRAMLFILASLLCQLLFYYNYAIWDVFVMYIPAYILLAILAGVGLGGILSLLKRIPWPNVHRILQPVLAAAALLVFVGPILTPRIPFLRDGTVPFIGADKYILQAPADLDDQLAERVVHGLAKNAIVLIRWDHLWQYWYAASVDQQRTDLRFIELYPFHQTPDLPRSTIDFIRASLPAHPVYLGEYAPEVAAAGFVLTPVGIDLLTFFQVREASAGPQAR